MPETNETPDAHLKREMPTGRIAIPLVEPTLKATHAYSLRAGKMRDYGRHITFLNHCRSIGDHAMAHAIEAVMRECADLIEALTIALRYPVGLEFQRGTTSAEDDVDDVDDGAENAESFPPMTVGGK